MNLALTIRVTALYFPLVFIYKALCPEYSEELHNQYYMWVNYFWLITHVWNAVIFINIRKNCFLKIHKLVALLTIGYSLVMSSLRVYLFFDIEKHYQVIDRAGLIGFGTVSLFLLIIFSTYKSWKN